MDIYPTLKLRGHVGFSSLPDQLVQKAKQNGFTFNLLFVGETGIGKSTLIESLFNMKFDLKPCGHGAKSVGLCSQTFDVEEGGIRLKVTIVETAGFGDQLDKETSVKVISEYINKQYELHLQEEMQIRRLQQVYKDCRVHVCVYCLSPTGHSLKALDVHALKDLCKKVNIIPIIAKSDTISKDELQRFKNRILIELKSNNIDYYKFPEDDETMRDSNAELNKSVPFAVVGSIDFVKIGNKDIRARQYPWGTVEVENNDHCDFVKLREALLRLNVEDLRERTHCILYELYRKNRLQEMGLKDGDLGPGFRQVYEQMRNQSQVQVEKAEKLFSQELTSRLEKKQKEINDKKGQVLEKENAILIDYKLKMSDLNDEEMKLNKEVENFELSKRRFLEKKPKKGK